MSETNPAEPPVNQGGGGGAPEPDTESMEKASAEPPVNQGGGSD